MFALHNVIAKYLISESMDWVEIRIDHLHETIQGQGLAALEGQYTVIQIG